MEVFSDSGKYDPGPGDLSEGSRDLDFNDVFGGPPRRFLMQEARAKCSFDEKVGPEEDEGSSSWGSVKEKAVFGGESVGRRRHLSQDFYDDIFRGDQSYVSPRELGRDRNNLMGLNPSWKTTSPARALSPRTETFSPSLPAPFRFSNQAVGEQEEIKHYIQPAHHQSPSSQDSRYSADNLKKDRKNIDSNGNKFHFSIYKWAGRGVPLVNRNSFMPKDDRRFETTMKIECENKDSRSEEEIKELDRNRVEEAVFDILDSNSRHDEDENVTFEVNSLHEFLQDEVEQSDDHNCGFNLEQQVAMTDKFISSVSGSFSWDPKASMGNPDNPFEDNFLVQELSYDLEEVIQSGEGSEDMKALGAEIRQWSSGKTGNIRSLLSTLQYVLWPGNGWKPIALVDLIEMNSVKRAYQKALLCLHPDKLQQRGAPSQHKYIAEKVFDILQEAWDHFNTLAPL